MNPKTVDLLFKIVPWIFSLLSLITTIILARRISFRKNIKEKQLDALVEFIKDFSDCHVFLKTRDIVTNDSHYRRYQLPSLVKSLENKTLRYILISIPYKSKSTYLIDEFSDIFTFIKHRNNIFLPHKVQEHLDKLAHYEQRLEAVSHPKVLFEEVLLIENGKPPSQKGKSEWEPIRFPPKEAGFLDIVPKVYLLKDVTFEELLVTISEALKAAESWLSKYGGRDLIYRRF